MMDIVMNGEQDSRVLSSQGAGHDLKCKHQQTKDKIENTSLVAYLKSENGQLKRQLIQIKQERGILRKAFKVFNSDVFSLSDS